MSIFNTGTVESAAGDIWSTGTFSFDSPLKDLLDNGNYTLLDLLGEDELLQELRGRHPQLVAAFSCEESVAGLIKCLFAIPPSETTCINDIKTQDDNRNLINRKYGEDIKRRRKKCCKDNNMERSVTQMKEVISSKEDYEKKYIRYPYMACEVICCEIDLILDILVDGHVPNAHESYEDNSYADSGYISKLNSNRQSILDLLFSVLTSTEASKLDDRRAGYLEKILCVLLKCKPASMAAYINGDHLQRDTSTTYKILDGNKFNSYKRYEVPNHKGGGILLLVSLLNHLYSHSVMQMLHRLLIPYPTSIQYGLKNKLLTLNTDNNINNEDVVCSREELNRSLPEDDRSVNEDKNSFNSESLDDLDLYSCRWAESDVILLLLISQLTGVNLEFCEYSCAIAPVGDEAFFHSSQHASEILIAMIQDSPLTSRLLNAVSTDPILSRIIRSAMGMGIPEYCSEESGNNVFLRFNRHESIMTISMSVLESLILRLGGHKAISSTSRNTYYGPDDNISDFHNNCINRSDGNINSYRDVCVESRNSLTHNLEDEIVNSISPTLKNVNPTPNNADLSRKANSDDIVNYIPILLNFLSSILTHPETCNWESYVQYSSHPKKVFGTSRLRIVRLIESLVLLCNDDVDHLLCKSNCLNICLDMFWEFTWCSMLHQSVSNLLVNVFEGDNKRVEVQKYFLNECDLLQKLMKSFVHTSVMSKDVTTNKGAKIYNKTQHSLSEVSPIDIEKKNTRNNILDENISNILGESVKQNNNIIQNNILNSPLPSNESHQRNRLSLDDGLNDKIISSNKGSIILIVKDNAGGAGEHVDDYFIEKLDKLSSRCLCNEVALRFNNKNNSEVEMRNSVAVVAGISQKLNSTRVQEPKICSTQSSDSVIELPFRMGYMGHVITICQALVRACGENIKMEENLGDYSMKQKLPENISYNNESDKKIMIRSCNSNGFNIDEPLVNQLPTSFPKKSCNRIVGNKHNKVLSILQTNPLYSKWKTFINTSLSSEISLISTPLGGGNETRFCSNSQNNYFTIANPIEFSDFDSNTNSSLLGNEEINLNDVDVDTAENMMGTLKTDEHSQELKDLNYHYLKNDLIGGKTENNDFHSTFETMGNINTKSGDYIYDDPLGCRHKFVNDVDDEKDVTVKSMNENVNKDIDENVPIMDLFAGNFIFDDTNKSKSSMGNRNIDNSHWEDFAHFDSVLTSSYNVTESRPVDFATSFDGNKIPNVFKEGNDSDIIDVSMDIFTVANTFPKDIKFDKSNADMKLTQLHAEDNENKFRGDSGSLEKKSVKI